MGMPAVTDSRYWTPADVWALPDDGNRYECIDGVLLVTPSPAWMHQDLALAFAMRLEPWARGRGLGRTLIAPADVRLAITTLVQPDVFITRPRADGSPAQEKDADLRLLLAIEILSPSTARRDRTIKRVLYQECGAEYWIVDPDARVVERWLPDDGRPEVLSASLAWQPIGASDALVIDLVALFRDALGD
jgi:Uma2 family endonuclease